jgi:acetylornithine deacetylase
VSDPTALLAQLVAFDTHNPGGDEPALAARLRDELARRRPDALELHEVPRPGQTGAYVAARWGTPRTLVNVHLDTVPPNAGWTGDPLVPRVADGRLTALGAADTKGAIAAILCALDEARPRDVAVLFSGDEEVSGTCVRAFLAAGGAAGIDPTRLERAVVCEPTSCRAGTRHRGVMALETRVRGKGGHSSRADHMPAPIVDLARLAVAFHEWGRAHVGDGPPGFQGMCLNVAKLDGGVAFNVVPETAMLSVSLRPPPGTDMEPLRDQLLALAARVVPAATSSVTLFNPAFATRDLAGFRPLLGELVDAPADLGFWTEAAVLAGAGMDVVVFGPGDIGVAHAADEFVPLGELARARDVFVRLFRESHGTR